MVLFLLSQRQKLLYAEKVPILTPSPWVAAPWKFGKPPLKAKNRKARPINRGDLSPYPQRSCLPQPGLLPPTTPELPGGLRQEHHLSTTVSQSPAVGGQHAFLRSLCSDSVLTGWKGLLPFPATSVAQCSQCTSGEPPTPDAPRSHWRVSVGPQCFPGHLHRWAKPVCPKLHWLSSSLRWPFHLWHHLHLGWAGGQTLLLPVLIPYSFWTLLRTHFSNSFPRIQR